MQGEPKRIVVVGSINMDLVAYAARIPGEGETLIGTDFQMQPGGKGANQAIAVARLGFPVSLIARVGSDAFGAEMKGHLSRAGVDVNAVAVTEGSSGTAMILVSRTGENSIVVTPGANARLMPEDLDKHIELLRSAGVVLAQLEIPIETVEHLALLCRSEGVPLILDPAPARPLSRRVLECADWFTPNETEAAFYATAPSMTGDSSAIAAELMGKGINGLMLKRGARGVYIQTAGGEGQHLDAFPVTAVDTTGAGDCFNGAFAVGLLMAKTPVESARFASAAAALSVEKVGAQCSMPSMAEVLKFEMLRI